MIENAGEGVLKAEPAPRKVQSRATRSTWDRLRWRALPMPLRRIILLAASVGVWQVYVSLSGVSSLQFASPYEAATALFDGFVGGSLGESTLVSLRMLAVGMAVGMGLAVVLTMISLFSQVGHDLLRLLTSILNPLPSIAILPLAILWFGLSAEALIFVLVNAVVWPLAINLSTGFRSVTPTLISVGRNIGLGRLRLVYAVLVPGALPHIFSGVRTAWAFAWRTLVAAELVFGVVGGTGGLGYHLNNASYNLDVPGVFAGLIVIAVVGLLVDLVFSFIERRTVAKWGMTREGST